MWCLNFVFVFDLVRVFCCRHKSSDYTWLTLPRAGKYEVGALGRLIWPTTMCDLKSASRVCTSFTMMIYNSRIMIFQRLIRSRNYVSFSEGMAGAVHVTRHAMVRCGVVNEECHLRHLQ